MIQKQHVSESNIKPALYRLSFLKLLLPPVASVKGEIKLAMEFHTEKNKNKSQFQCRHMQNAKLDSGAPFVNL